MYFFIDFYPERRILPISTKETHMFQTAGLILAGAILVVIFPTFGEYVVNFVHWFASLLQNAQVQK